jgi:hypothetical protein
MFLYMAKGNTLITRTGILDVLAHEFGSNLVLQLAWHPGKVPRL